MDWSFFDEFITFFSDLFDFGSFLGSAFAQLPTICGFVLSFVIIVTVIAGTVKYCFKLIG